MQLPPPSGGAAPAPALDGQKIVAVGRVEYLVDLETFVVMSRGDDPEEVGVWDDDAGTIEFFDGMGEDGGEPGVAVEAAPVAEPAVPAPDMAAEAPAASGAQAKIIMEDDDNLEVELDGKEYLVTLPPRSSVV